MEFLPLLEICNVYQPQTIAKKTLTSTGKYPVYGANGIIGYHNAYNHAEEEVVMGCRGSCGAVHISRPQSWINGNAMVIHPNGKYPLTKLYLKYCLLSTNRDKVITGTAQPQITKQSLEGFLIPVCPPPKQEQTVSKIEELFSEIDNAVSSLKAAKQKLTAYRQSILKEAFQGNLSKSWRSLHTSPSFAELRELVNEQKQEAGNKKKYKYDRGFPLCSLPSGWGWIPLGEAIKGVEYGSAQKSNKSGQIPVLRMGNIQNGQIDWSDLVFTSDQAEIEKYHLKGNDVLFNRTNSPAWVGKTAIYNGERPAIFAGYLIRINYLPIINPHYLTYYLNSHTAKKYSNLVKTDGVNQSNISGSKLCTYPFPMTSSAEQVEIVSLLNRRLSICDSLEDAIYKALQESVALKQSILQKAFEGDLV